MDWREAINRNRDALIVIILALMKSLGLVKGGALTTLPFHLYRKSLLILRPAEAAVRRLIMMAAYDMKLRGIKIRQRTIETTERPASSFPNASNFAPSFNLIDPLKSFTGELPDFKSLGPSFDDDDDETFIIKTRVPAAGLGRRLLALKAALDSIPRHARRLNRWYELQAQHRIQNRPSRFSPLRPGTPPGYKRKPIHPVEEILLDCHSLAQLARERRDSS